MTQVYPTGSVSPTFTSFTTTTVSIDDADVGYLYYPITVTDCFVPSAALICTADMGCPSNPLLSPPNITNPANIATRYFAPYTITQPTTCTKTSFLCTSSAVVFPTDPFWPGIDIAVQATQPDEAIVVTTYVVTVSTDLGG
jgi:hypothetical protein